MSYEAGSIEVDKLVLILKYAYIRNYFLSVVGIFLFGVDLRGIYGHIASISFKIMF